MLDSYDNINCRNHKIRTTLTKTIKKNIIDPLNVINECQEVLKIIDEYINKCIQIVGMYNETFHYSDYLNMITEIRDIINEINPIIASLRFIISLPA